MMANALLGIQIIPKVPGGGDMIPYVDEAIAVIGASGVRYEVGPLETVMEGELATLLDIVKQMNEKMIEAGCPGVLSQLKISYRPEGTSMDALTEKYRG